MTCCDKGATNWQQNGLIPLGPAPLSKSAPRQLTASKVMHGVFPMHDFGCRPKLRTVGRNCASPLSKSAPRQLTASKVTPCMTLAADLNFELWGGTVLHSAAHYATQPGFKVRLIMRCSYSGEQPSPSIQRVGKHSKGYVTQAIEQSLTSHDQAVQLSIYSPI